MAVMKCLEVCHIQVKYFHLLNLFKKIIESVYQMQDVITYSLRERCGPMRKCEQTISTQIN